MLEHLDRSRTDVVLIVDDVPDNLSLLHDALDEAGYTVLVATHGEAACSGPRRRCLTSSCWTPSCRAWMALRWRAG